LFDRLVLLMAGVGLGVSVALHLGQMAGAGHGPVTPWWSWLLHAGAGLGFWCAAGRVAAAGLRGLSGILRIRRMVPIPVRVILALVSLNALVTGYLAMSGHVVFGRALSAYWTMVYLVVTILFVFVVGRRADGGTAGPVAGRPGRGAPGGA
jgi:hypothetical protein